MLNKAVLLLDMFGVIVTEDHLVTNVTSRLFPGVRLDDQRQAYHAYEQGRIGAGEYWARLASPWTTEESERRIVEHFPLDRGFAPLARDLRARLDIAVLSNVPRDWKPRLLAIGLEGGSLGSERLETGSLGSERLASVVREFFASGEERLWKPDPVFFRLACERLRVTPDQCIFVDDQKRNLATASELGMTTVWVDRSASAEPGRGRQGTPSAYQPDFTVPDMTGLHRLLTNLIP